MGAPSARPIQSEGLGLMEGAFEKRSVETVLDQPKKAVFVLPENAAKV